MSEGCRAFLDSVHRGLGKYFDIRFTRIDKKLVVITLPVRPEYLTETDVVQGGIIMTVADIAGALGAVLNLPEGFFTSTIESKTNFLRKGAGDLLTAESRPIHIGRTTSVWRTNVLIGKERSKAVRIAEVTQTQIHLPDPGQRDRDKNAFVPSRSGTARRKTRQG